LVRIAVFAFGVAVLASILTHGNQVAIIAGFLIGLVIAIAPIARGASALRCPFCRKRVKLGAVSCHHCGRLVGKNVR